MSGRICFAVDIGGSGIKMLTVRSQGQNLEILDQSCIPNPPIQQSGHVYIDIPYILDAIENKLCFLFDNHIIPQTMGIDTFGNGYGFLNQTLALEELPYFYKDTRTKGIMGQINSHCSVYELYEKTGLYPTEIRVLMQLFLDASLPDSAIHRCKWVLLLPDLLNFLLTGQISAEESMASVASLLDVKGKCWNRDVFSLLNIPSEIFPPLISGGRVLGNLRSEIAKKVHGNLQVIAVTSHDTESALLSIPDLDEHCVFASIGTSLIFGTRVPTPIVTQQAFDGAFKIIKGPFHYSLCRDFNAMWLLEKCMQYWRETSSALDYSDIIALCETADENHTYLNVCDPMLRTESGNIIDKITEYCIRTEQEIPRTIGEIANCILDSIVVQSLWSFHQIQQITCRTSYHKLVVIGGGSKNRLLMQRTADALQIPVIVSSNSCSALGNVLMQLYATNTLSNLSDIQCAARHLFCGIQYMPQEKNGAKWNYALSILDKIDKIRSSWR